MVEAEMLSGYETLEMKNTPSHFGLGGGGSGKKPKTVRKNPKNPTKPVF